MTIVTGAKQFTDIDCLACAIAYAKLINAVAVLPGPLNSTVSNTIKNWRLDFQSDVPADISEIVIVDVSEQKVLENDWEVSKITKLFDHHFGHEKYWQEKLGQSSHIEPVGACATQIWEQWAKSDKQIDPISANLLTVAIVSNTLNFNAGVTTDRDKIAYSQLTKFTSLPLGWQEQYYSEVESSIFENPAKSISEDTKIVALTNLNLEINIGQLELWNGKEFIEQNQQVIFDTLRPGGEYWLMTIPSISEGKNYLFTQNSEIKSLLTKHINAQFEKDLGTTSRLYLRKEILRELLQA